MKVFDTQFKVFSNETVGTSLIFSSVFLLYYNYSYVCTFAAFVIETPKGVLCASISEEEHTVVAARKKTSQRKHIKLDCCPPCSPGIQSIVFIHQYSLVRPSVCPSGGFLFSSAHLSDTVLKNPLEFEQRQMGENWGFIWYSTSILLFFCEMRE